MTTFAPHRETLESFVDCINHGADKDTLTRLLADDVVLRLSTDCHPTMELRASGE